LRTALFFAFFARVALVAVFFFFFLIDLLLTAVLLELATCRCEPRPLPWNPGRARW
jgi:hypothetical protein